MSGEQRDDTCAHLPVSRGDEFSGPTGLRKPPEVVNLGYVVNVIENAEERAAALCEAWALIGKLLIVSARLIIEATAGHQTPYEDGWLTQRGTFQKYYQQHELRGWIDETLTVGAREHHTPYLGIASIAAHASCE